VTSLKRAGTLPAVPTVAESGVPGYEYSTWYGLLAPARVPRAILDRLNQETVAALKDPEIRQRYLAQGVDPIPSTAAHFAAYIKSETEKWTKVIVAAKIPPQ
jgi:tripartite-type tricarboxylate transporter receptor subunit TctC